MSLKHALETRNLRELRQLLAKPYIQKGLNNYQMGEKKTLTPYLYIVSSEWNHSNAISILKLLIERGADPFLETKGTLRTAIQEAQHSIRAFFTKSEWRKRPEDMRMVDSLVRHGVTREMLEDATSHMDSKDYLRLGIRLEELEERAEARRRELLIQIRAHMGRIPIAQKETIQRWMDKNAGVGEIPRLLLILAYLDRRIQIDKKELDKLAQRTNTFLRSTIHAINMMSFLYNQAEQAAMEVVDRVQEELMMMQ